ncbi:28S rRNA (cytosine-C(5))-methyltransferase [Biomphalaria pfeifferi]|uniref:28S rRNA (Cytosine-C(5))-methyltransferase n=1 Tax=Biomphalaria pfeifferi TaxID=112525 RepID=A0AAD8BZJ5_BIOPF|nr:28S rRNA (cytosine-C(5))-methyltransferase [Biomphalaria pfeifferi]
MDSLYIVAGSILKKSLSKKASLKTLIYDSGFNNIPKLTALTTELVKNNELLQEILSHFDGHGLLSEDIVEGKKEIALALLYEELVGNRFGKNVALRKVMRKHKAEIKAAVDKVLSAHNVKYLKILTKRKNSKADIKIPRYMRVNLIRSSPDDVIKHLQDEGWDFVGKLDLEKFKEQALSLREDQFALDPLLFDVLVFPVGTILFNHALTLSGTLVQQDKASCIPAHVLKPPSGSVVLDCCAAPGNKTSHLASLMKDDGKVIALDQSLSRMQTMSHLLEKIGSKCVELINQDFLTVQSDAEDAQKIEFILVDPTCSSSGMLGVQQGKDNYSTDQARLETLSRFQITILKHALKFPNVQRIVYSTCSIHKEENEQVVEQVMSHVSHHFKFKKVFPELKNCRGLDGFPHSKYFLRLSTENDLTQGFFVACFQRRKKVLEQIVKAIKTAEHCNKNKKMITETTDLQESAANNKFLTSDSKFKKKKKKEKPLVSVVPSHDMNVELKKSDVNSDTKKKKYKKPQSLINGEQTLTDEENKKKCDNFSEDKMEGFTATLKRKHKRSLGSEETKSDGLVCQELVQKKKKRKKEKLVSLED